MAGPTPDEVPSRQSPLFAEVRAGPVVASPLLAAAAATFVG